MRLTYGINKFDGYWQGQKPDREFVYVAPIEVNCSWAEFVETLRIARDEHKPRHPDEKDTCTPWVGPFLLGRDGEGRGLDNVIGMADWAGFDLDVPGWTLDRLLKLLRGIRCVIHTTTKSRPYPDQRWRIIVQLDREHSCEEYGAVWAMMNDMLGGSLDRPTFNCNRVLFVPAQWIGADNLFIAQDGEPLSIGAILAAGYEPHHIEVHQPVKYIGVTERPEGRPIVTPNMEQQFVGSPPGGRFWKLLCQAAVCHLENDWELSAHELCDAALTVSDAYAGVKRQNPLREAERALGWAQATVVPKTPLQRLRESHAYHLSTKRF